MKIVYILGLAAAFWWFYHMGGNAQKLACNAQLNAITQSSAESKQQSEDAIYAIETQRITAERAANDRYRRLESRLGKPAVTCVPSAGGRVHAVIDPDYSRVLLEAVADPRLAKAPSPADPADTTIPAR